MLVYLNSDWQYPKIPGLNQFQGKLMHSAKWDATYDLKGKTVAVVGGGSSAVQIVPSIQPGSSNPDHLVLPLCLYLTPERSRRETDPLFEITSMGHDGLRSQVCWAWRHKFHL
jgi:hypothetical protein